MYCPTLALPAFFQPLLTEERLYVRQARLVGLMNFGMLLFGAAYDLVPLRSGGRCRCLLMRQTPLYW